MSVCLRVCVCVCECVCVCVCVWSLVIFLLTFIHSSLISGAEFQGEIFVLPSRVYLASTRNFGPKCQNGNECSSGFAMILLVRSLFRHEVKRISGLTRLILPSLVGLYLRNANAMGWMLFISLSIQEW